MHWLIVIIFELFKLILSDHILLNVKRILEYLYSSYRITIFPTF